MSMMERHSAPSLPTSEVGDRCVSRSGLLTISIRCHDYASYSGLGQEAQGRRHRRHTLKEDQGHPKASWKEGHHVYRNRPTCW